MTIFLIDGSINGLLCSLFFAFTEKVNNAEVFEEKIYQPRIDAKLVKITTEKDKADRVRKALEKYGEDDVMQNLKKCTLSSIAYNYTVAYKYAYAVLEARGNVFNNYSDIRVSSFREVIQRVSLEAHNVGKGFLRFHETVRGVLYAVYSPDNNITELIAPHFLSRLGYQPFIIHDIGRGRIAISDGATIRYGYTEKKAVLTFSKNELSVRELWKRFYDDVSIESRKNTRQQDRCMPRRYRKFMPETYEKQ